MRNRRLTCLAIQFFVLLQALSPFRLSAQTFNLLTEREPLTELTGLWRFHLGDDANGKLGWSDPTFDDSHWPLLRSDQSWSQQGYKGYSGFAWYRFTILPPGDREQLAIGIPRLLTSYEIFADGRLTGQFGSMPPHPTYLVGFDQIFDLPPDTSASPRPITIAIRVWQSDSLTNAGGGPQGAPVVGKTDAIRAWKEHNNWGRFWSLASGNTLMLMNLLAAFAGFFLFWMRPADREFLWFGFYELLTGVDHLCDDRLLFYPNHMAGNWLFNGSLAAASWLFFLLFVFGILNGRKNRLYWAAIGTPVATVVALLLAVGPHVISMGEWRIAWAVFLIPYFACILGLLYRRAREGVPDARMLLWPVGLCYASWFAEVILLSCAAYGQTWVSRYFAWFFQLSNWPFPFSFQDVTDMIMLLAVMAVLPLRFARARSDEERLAAEMESARAVQQVLIPTEIPTIPGFRIQCVYKPAGHVGGDFFQIIPLASGSFLMAVGDVSGKGMPAAMTVSLLVGTFRTLAHYTHMPSKILNAMNQRMLARSHGGFTTCLVLHVTSDGTVTVANAGHLAPYLDGGEVKLDNGLPLGLAAESEYPQTTLQLPDTAQLTLITDGIIEARARSGELLGFERSAQLSTQSADSIAQAALAFGQEDDITVLTVVRVDAAERELTGTPSP